MLKLCSVCNGFNMFTSENDFSHPINESLVELLHGSLQLAALVLPLLIVTHRLLGGALPCRSTGYVVHIVNPPHRVYPALPPTDEEEF